MRSRDCNRVSGVYELKLKHRIDIDSPGPLRQLIYLVITLLHNDTTQSNKAKTMYYYLVLQA